MFFFIKIIIFCFFSLFFLLLSFFRRFVRFFSFFLVCFFACVSFHFLFLERLFTSGQAKGNVRDGRSRHQSFRVCKVNLATRKVATNCPLSPVRDTTTSNEKRHFKATLHSSSSCKKKACRSGLRACCAKEHNMEFSTLCSPLLIGERPAILIVCGPVDCRFLLHEEKVELTVWPTFTWSVLSAGRCSHPQGLPGLQKGPHSFPARSFPNFSQISRDVFAEFLTLRPPCPALPRHALGCTRAALIRTVQQLSGRAWTVDSSWCRSWWRRTAFGTPLRRKWLLVLAVLHTISGGDSCYVGDMRTTHVR